MTKRSQTQTERDESSYLAKLKRDSDRLAAPHEVPEDITSQYEGVDLDQAREDRELIDRVRHLEKKNDELLKKLLEMAGAKFTSNVTIVEANASFWRRNGERAIAAVIAVLGAIGAYFLGRGNTK